LPLWTDYRYDEKDYISLINTLKQNNKYRYAILLQECNLKGSVGRFKVLKLSEGYLILSRFEKIRKLNMPLIDLTQHSLKLICYILLIPPNEDRIRLQVNRNYLRLLLKRIKAVSSSKYWYGSKRKFTRDYLKYVNQVVLEGNRLIATCFVHKSTIYGFNKKLKKLVFDHLTNIQGMSASKANFVISKYLTFLRR
jgi:hypothetical protein